MDQRPKLTGGKEQFLRVAEAKEPQTPCVEQRATLSVPPVTLERRCLTMQAISTASTSSTTSTAAASSTTSPTQSTLSTSSSSSAATAEATPVEEAAFQASTHAVTARAAPVGTTLPHHLQLLQPTATPAAEAFVGKRRAAPGDDSPVIILTHHQDEAQEEPVSGLRPGPDSSSSRKLKRQEQTTLFLVPNPEEARSHLSTQEPTRERGRDLERSGGRPAVHSSMDVSPKRDVTDVMQFFQEQEKSLQASFLSLPKTSHRKQRSPSPKIQHAAGLQHLDNLIHLMEQLTSLKDENSRLRKRCDYLESTKVLLQAKRDLSFESSSSSSGFVTLQTKHKHHHHPHHHYHHHHHHQHLQQQQLDTAQRTSDVAQLARLQEEGSSRMSRPRISSAEELGFFESVDTSSDQRPKRPKPAMHKRSFSTGSLEVPSDFAPEVTGLETRKRSKSKQGRSIFSKSTSSKQKTKGSKWARVKKVLTGQKLYEDLGTTIRSIRDLGRSSHHDSGPVLRVTTEDARPLNGKPSIEHDHPIMHTSMTESYKSVDTEDGDTGLTSDIWMGPPDWWEEYEARKESGGSSNSDVSSVIEVTTMYLGTKKEPTISTLAPPSPSHDNYLTVEKSLPRRQSSPSLSVKEAAEEDDVLDELAVTSESRRILHKSSSCKSADLDLPKSSEFSPGLSEGRQSKKLHRTAWGRVKDIIHTRKDSIRKRPKRERTGVDSEEPSEVDMEAILEDQWRAEGAGEGRTTPKTSPLATRQHNGRGEGLRTPPSGGHPKRSPTRTSSYQGGTADMAALLAGSLSDEFARKMQEWEAMRSKKSTSSRASVDEGDRLSMEISGTSQDYPIRTIDLRDFKGKVPDSSSDVVTVDESNTSMEVLGAHSINVDEIQKRITESFSRKMQEWERLKYKSPAPPPRDISPEMERKISKCRKEDRQKSKRSREDKEKEKWERQRERDMQKVEREQQKLEKEKVRIEKERLRTLEREAKLEKLKGRLSQSEGDSSSKSPTLTSLAEYKVTADFARKLHEWELRKGLSHDVSNSIYMEAQKMSLKLSEEEQDAQEEKENRRRGQRSETGGRKGVPPPPLTLQPYWDSPEDTSPVERLSEVSLGDDDTCTSVTEECLTKSNIAALERANAQLLENLQQKELEYTTVQDEVQKVKDKLAKVRDEHAAEMARFHRDLAQGNFSGPVKLEVGELESTMMELEERIKLMENFGEKLAMSMESAAVGKWQSIEGEETVHTQLVELVDQMRVMLIQASKSDEHSQKTMALSNFETLYSQAMKLQVQMNNLRLSHLERNREIMSIKRQLLLQEVNNLLLQADITRRETELYQFQEARKFASLKRWNTFGGSDRQRPQVILEVPSSTPSRSVIETPTRSVIDRETIGQAPEGSRVNIPYMSEETFRPSPYVSSYMSAPASPTTLAAAAPPPAAAPILAAGQRHSGTGAPRELTRDQLQTFLVLPPALRTLSPTIQRSSTLKRADDPARDSSATSEESQACGQTLQKTQRTLDASKQADAAETSKSVTLKTESQAAASAKPEITTLCDSAPLFREIEELKRVKGKVERGSPTLIRRKRDGPSPAPSPGEGARTPRNLEAPDPTIPQQRGPAVLSTTAEAAKLINDDIFPIKSVIECTEDVFIEEKTPLSYDFNARESSVGERPHPALPAGVELPPMSDPGKVSRTKHKILRRQKEETKIKDYQAISPKGSPIATRGKPPLPRTTTPTKPSPSSSPAPDKSPRSKSLGDVEHGASSAATHEPKQLQDAINRFEKRATVCETEDRPIELRKTPSPTLHLPRVGLVTRVRRLKPAAELLEESQRYRSGSSIYATRIMPRYLNKEESKFQDPSKTTTLNKENVTGTYVHAIVRRLSRESTPSKSAASSRTNSELSLKRADSPRAQSEFVSQIVRKLSSSSSTDARGALVPFKDLTNEGMVKKLAQSFNAHPSKISPERTLSDSDIDRQAGEPSATGLAQHRKSCDVAMVMVSTSPTSGESVMISSMSSNEGSVSAQPSSSTPTNHQSLPTLAAPSSAAEEAARHRAATYSVPETEKPKPSEAQSTKQQMHTGEESGKKPAKSKSKSSKAEKKGESSRSPERRGTGRGETVGVLCKQSISFDLGVSLYTQKPESEPAGKSRQARSWDPSETIKAEVAAAASLDPPGPSMSPRASSPMVLGASAMEEFTPGSSGFQGEVPPGSPTSEDKKKRRFLDASWLQRSKKFFKVSK